MEGPRPVVIGSNCRGKLHYMFTKLCIRESVRVFYFLTFVRKQQVNLIKIIANSFTNIYLQFMRYTEFVNKIWILQNKQHPFHSGNK